MRWAPCSAEALAEADLEEAGQRMSGSLMRSSLRREGGALEARAYTRSLLSST